MINWFQWDHLLGSMPDKELAQRIGTTDINVRTRRCRKHIPNYHPANIIQPPPPPVYDPPLRLVLREDGKAIEREIVTPTGERHLVKVENPDNQYVASNGMIYDDKRHHIVKGPPGGGTHAIHEGNATQYQAKRYEAAERAARDAIANATGQPNSIKGWQKLVESQVGLAREAGPYSTNAFKAVGSAAGLLRDRREGEKPGGVTLDISADVARLILERLKS